MIILKIIGIAILAVLGLVLAAVLIVLLVPIRYSLSGSYDKAPKAKGSLTWLLHLISITVSYERQLDVTIKILGRSLSGRQASEKEEQDKTEMSCEVPHEPGEQERPTPGDEEEQEQEDFLPELSEARKEKEAKGKKGSKKGRKQKKDQSKEEQKRSDNGSGIKEKIRSRTEAFREKWEEIKARKETIETFLRDKENQKTIRLVWRQTKALIRHILPRKVKGSAVLGFDDPSTTGNVLALLSILYVWYGDALKVTPVFDEKVLEIEGSLKGRLRVGTVLILVIRVLLNKNFRLLVRRWRKKGGK